MEALIELCDLIAQNPAQFSEKLSWICAKCPPPESLSAESPRVSRSQLNAILVVARFLSKCSDCSDLRPKSVVLEFLRSIPYSFDQSYWPQSYNVNSIASFFEDFLSYVVKATKLSREFSNEVAEFTGEVIISAIGRGGELSGISKAFLVASSQNFIPISAADASKLVTCLIDQFAFTIPVTGAPVEHNGVNSESSSAQSSPLNVNYHYQHNSIASPGNSASTASSRGSVMNGDRNLWLSSADQLTVNLGLNDGGASGTSSGLQVASFEEESVGSLEKQEIAFKLIAHILDQVQIDPGLLEQVGSVAKKQIQSMSVFLRIRKKEWNEQGSLLKARINAKLSVYQAAVKLKSKFLASLDSEGKSVKRLIYGAVALLIDAAEACLLSVWRKLKTCEELFSSLLLEVSEIAISRGGQPLRILLIRLKPIVLTVCAQADTWRSNQGVMFESVTKASCQIIESCWSQERAPVDTYIMGLAASIRERNDYEEQVHIINNDYTSKGYLCI